MAQACENPVCVTYRRNRFSVMQNRSGPDHPRG